MSGTKYVSVADVMSELGVGRTKAYAILKECTRIVSGGIVRVSRQAFEGWKIRHSVPACDDLTRGLRLADGRWRSTAELCRILCRMARHTTP